MLPELGRSVVVEAAAHGRTFLQMSYRLNSDVRSVSQHFKIQNRYRNSVSFLYPIEEHIAQTISSNEDLY